MFDDIVKQDIKALRAKGMSLEESFGRIAGGAELLGGIAQLVMNPKQAIPTILSGGSKVLLGKVAGKIKDPDYLIKTGYEKLKKKSTIPNSKLQSTQKPVKLESSSKPLANAKIPEKVPVRNAQVPLKDGASKPKSLQALMRSKGGFIKLP